MSPTAKRPGRFIEVNRKSFPRPLIFFAIRAALDAHAKLQAQRPPLPEGLRLGAGEREDYTYNRTR